MKLTYAILDRIAFGTPDAANAQSFLQATNTYGDKFGATQPHRLAQIVAQVMQESGEFRYDREVWGPTPAQKRYDTRTDLGNTPEKDGDGYKNRGRGPLQVTGGHNINEFEEWCVRWFGRDAVPDFTASPDLINTDPWEGLSVYWYWDTRKLNRYADQGDTETISVRVNGGRNGLDERITYYTRTALVFLGYDPDDVRGFQTAAKANGIYTGEVDGDAGPKTRAALHKYLVALTPENLRSNDVQDAPVVGTKLFTPPQIDKPVTKTTGFWERIVQLGGSGTIAAAAAFFQDWKVVVAVAGASIVITIIGLVLHKRIIDAVKAAKEAIG